jgi:hypothetical protein
LGIGQLHHVGRGAEGVVGAGEKGDAGERDNAVAIAVERPVFQADAQVAGIGGAGGDVEAPGAAGAGMGDGGGGEGVRIAVEQADGETADARRERAVRRDDFDAADRPGAVEGEQPVAVGEVLGFAECRGVPVDRQGGGVGAGGGGLGGAGDGGEVERADGGRGVAEDAPVGEGDAVVAEAIGLAGREVEAEQAGIDAGRQEDGPGAAGFDGCDDGFVKHLVAQPEDAESGAVQDAGVGGTGGGDEVDAAGADVAVELEFEEGAGGVGGLGEGRGIAVDRLRRGGGEGGKVERQVRRRGGGVGGVEGPGLRSDAAGLVGGFGAGGVEAVGEQGGGGRDGPTVRRTADA